MSSSASAAAPGDWHGGLLLPTNVVPTRYDVALAPNLTAWTFQGQVNIELKVVESTSRIVCHSLDLTYTSASGSSTPPAQLLRSVVDSGSADNETVVVQSCKEILLDEPSQRVSFEFAEPIAPGVYVLAVSFDGILNDQLCGFYRSAYTSARDNQPKFMAVTQFEATDCRRALPCWDEPLLKAVFAVTLVVEPTQNSISNMPVIRSQTILQSEQEQRADPACRGIVVPKGYIRYIYADTPLMSSYLLAFVVGEFDYLSTFSETKGVPGARPVELRIYTPVGQTKLGEFALDVAKKCLQLFETFFQVPYPLPKADLIAIPDFASGAMENWGAITYRDTMLLIDPDNSSALIKQRCAKTISHELSHMWFGNLVTMNWWSALWLNEGFARYCESWAIDVIFPEWQAMEQFINEVYGLAQSMDSLESSHAVELDVSTPEEINEIFDPINYNKGASLIRMLIQTIGPDAFQRGLQIYLTKFAYKNTTSVDLWNCMTAATVELGKKNGGVAFDIQQLFNTWVKEMGYPVLNVEEDSSAHKKECRCFAVSQSKFLQSGKPTAVATTSSSTAVIQAAGTTWHVPLAIGEYTTSTATTIGVTQRILEKLSGQIEVPSDKPDAIYSFNHGSSGFYRVCYAPALFQNLSTLVAKQVLPPLDRLSLLRDCFSLSSCGQGYSIANLFDLIVLFQGERNFSILQFLSLVLSNICSLHQQQPYYPQLQKFVVKIFGARWAELGWGPAANDKAALKKEHHLTFLERAILLQMIGGFSGDSSVQKAAWEKLQAFVADPVKNFLQPDLRSPVYTLAIKEKGDVARQLLIQFYLSSTSSEERVRILSSLGTTQSSSVCDDATKEKEITALLDWVFKSGHVRNGDLIFAFTAIGQDSKLSRTLCWNYFKANWDDLLSRFKGAMFVLGRIFPSILGEMSSEAEAEEFEAFFATHPAVGAERSVKQSSETVRMKSARLAREVPVIENWFQQHQL